MDEFKKGYLYARAMHTSTFPSEFFCVLQRRGVFYMARFLHHDFSCTRCKQSMLLLSSLWIMGLLSGIWVFAASDPSVISLMRSAVYSPVSIVGLLFVTGLPFLLSAFAVFLSCRWLVLSIVFCKGICLSYVSLGVMLSFGNAGWLICLLAGFSDAVAAPLLFWFWMTCFEDNDPLRRYKCLMTAAIVILAGSVEYSLIQPFLAELLIL